MTLKMNSSRIMLCILCMVAAFSLNEIAFSQEGDWCRSIEPPVGYEKTAIQTYSLNPDCVVDLPVVLHIVRENDGSSGISLTEARQCIPYLNTSFAPYNIQFHEKSNDEVWNSDYYHSLTWESAPNPDDHEYYYMTEAHDDPDAINIYFVSSIVDAAGIAYTPGTSVVVVNEYRTNGVITHEMGHCVSLWHTHGKGYQENVARSGGQSNCAAAGDKLCDTPAEPYVNELGRKGLDGIVYGNCIYHGTMEDDYDVPFNPVPLGNYMSYIPVQCYSFFTPGQVEKMRANIANDKRNMLQTVQVTFDNKLQSGQSAGGRIYANDSPGNVPFTRDFAHCLKIEEYPEYDRYPSGTPTEKHNNWNDEISAFRMFNTAFAPSSGPGTQYAWFKPMHTVSFHTHFADNSTAIDFDFKDPWYVESGVYNQPNAYATVSSGFTPTGHYAEQTGGIMAEMRYDQSHQEFPYYAMQVPFILNGNKAPVNPSSKAVGDWVCYGMFADVPGGINPAFAGDNWVYPFWDNAFTRGIELDEYAGASAVTAEFTGHRCSISNVPPTRNNSQRKIARENAVHPNPAILHTVYESNGKVFYSRSDDNGTSWTPEQLASDYYDAASNPSIATSNHGWIEPTPGASPPSLNLETNVIYMVYLATGGAQDEVVVKWRPVYESDWDPPTPWTEIDRIPTGYASTPVICSPMIDNTAISGGEKSSCVVVWEDTQTLKYSIYVNGVPMEGYVGGQATTFRNLTLATGRYWSGTNVQPKYPSISVQPVRLPSSTLPERPFSISWNEMGQLYHTILDYEFQGQGSQWTVAQLSPNMTIRPPVLELRPLNTAAPSVAYHYDEPTITYETISGSSIGGGVTSGPILRYPVPSRLVSSPLNIGTKSYFSVVAPYPIQSTQTLNNRKNIAVYRRQFDPTTNTWPIYWWSLQTNYPASYLSPIAGSEKFLIHAWSDNLHIALNQSNSSHYSVVVNLPGNSATSVPGIDGFDPNAIACGPTIPDIFSYNYYQGFDYRMESGFAKSAATTTVEAPVLRQAFVYNDDSCFATYGICMPHYLTDGGERVEISWANIPRPDSTEFVGALSMEDLMRTGVFTAPENGFVEYATQLYAFNPDEFGGDFSFNIKFYSSDNDEVLMEHEIPLSDLPVDSSFYVVYKLDVSAIENQSVYMTLGLKDTTAGLYNAVVMYGLLDGVETEKTQAQTEAIPASVTLNQNHPNPFNPSTEITYGVPLETHVKLTVFDQLGREVKTLVNGTKSAGTYTVTFDAGDLPSGMYLYRIETKQGTVSKKMVLMR